MFRMHACGCACKREGPAQHVTVLLAFRLSYPTAAADPDTGMEADVAAGQEVCELGRLVGGDWSVRRRWSHLSNALRSPLLFRTHDRPTGTSTTKSIRRYASPSSPTPRCCGRRPTSAMRSTRRGAPDPAQHDQINFYGTSSFDVETELRREGHRPLHPPAASTY
jgi:hypothetical protein